MRIFLADKSGRERYVLKTLKLIWPRSPEWRPRVAQVVDAARGVVCKEGPEVELKE
jgi:hypothetical protein